MSFDTLGLHPLLVEAVAKAGYETPTPVQTQAIPVALEKRDLMVSSATGSGKTAAFMLPALQALTTPSTKSGRGARIVVLTPTRELAMQVTRACEGYGRALQSLRTVSILGGVPYVHQQRLLRQYVDVMVATPGRLIDYLQRGMIDFSRVEMLVLDEADRMLDMGFIEDIEHIVSKMPEQRQTLMFSATFGGHVGRVAQQWLRDPVSVTVATQRDTHENIEQRLHYTRGYANKLTVLEYLLRDASVNQAIVFTATQREAEALSETLSDQGFVSASLHGGMNQRQRTRTLQQVRQGRCRILVATDVAARGLDVQGISHVINFDLPKMAEDYVHRIGRTGRAGRQGVALTLADVSEHRHVQRIERFTTQRIPVHAIEGLAPVPTEVLQRASRNHAGGRGGNREHRFGSDRNGGGTSSRRSRFGEGGYANSSSGYGRDGRGNDERRRSFDSNHGGRRRHYGESFDQREQGAERRPFESERRPFDSERRPFESDRRSFDRARPSAEHGKSSSPRVTYANARRRREWDSK